MEWGDVLTGLTALLAAALAVFWWRRQDLLDGSPARRLQRPFALFLAVVCMGNLATLVARLAQ